MRIGSEILGYTEYDAEEGLVTLAANGRGLMGSAEQPHEPGEAVYFLTSRSVSELTGPVTADSPLFPLEDLEGFAGSGTARIDDELVHWTRQRGSMLEMPARSTAVGTFDGQGSGMFRGRYGSVAGGHAAGTLMVQHPFRYWDRWAEHADAPELAYYGLHHAQDDAFWRRAFWVMEPTVHPGPRLGLLMRADPTVPWDAVPEEQAELYEMFDDDLDVERQGAWIGGQSDRLEFRVFVRHEPGSFDALEGMAHGWKGVPELQLLGLEYFAPGRTLRRAER